MTRGASSPELRLAQPADLPQIALFLIPLGGELFAERFPGQTAEDFYRWKYFGNPAGDAIVAIATAGNESSVVSVVAATPKRIWLSGKIVLGYELGDFLTNENYRKKGLFSQLIELVCREAAARGSVMVYVRPNDVSFPILTSKLAFHEPMRIDARRFVIPSYTVSRKTGIPAKLLRLSGMDWLAQSYYIPKAHGSSVTVLPVERFGKDIDQLWQSASAGYDFALVRDSEYLNWRFAVCPTPYKLWLAHRNSQAVGFVVTSADRATPTAAVVDLFAESGDAEAIRALLAASMGELLKSGAQLISTWTLQSASPGPAQSAAAAVTQRAFPLRRKQPLHLAFRILAQPEITLPQTKQKWHFTLGDSDGA
jgi:GNAT superfamily N-acetyltransferase